MREELPLFLLKTYVTLPRRSRVSPTVQVRPWSLRAQLKLVAPGLAESQVVHGNPSPGSLNVEPGLQTTRSGGRGGVQVPPAVI